MPTTALLDPLADARWRRFVASATDPTPFHHPAWLDLVRRQYRYPVAAACVLDGGGEVVAGMPLVAVASRLTGRRLVCVPFSDACGPLLAPGAPGGALDLLAGAVTRERERRGVALEVHEGFPAAGTTVDLFHRHLVPLSDGPDAVEKAFHSRVRRNTRKARKAGVTVARETGREALDAFYALHLQTRRRLGVPTQPRSFIRGLERLFDEGLGFVALARHEGRPVAAAVFLHAGPTLLYKFGASDEAALQLRPNNVLFTDVIRWASEAGFRALDLGRTDFGHEGLRAFKLSWGADERTLAYTYAGTAPPAPGESARDRILAAIIQRTPPVTGQAIGQLLYRHAG
jgi:CelD/BcsL family acetyltransferase involved in cellulose biosynthesis